MGVSLFFVLSGFVLSLPYFLGNREMGSGPEIKAFYLHRAWRLLPLFLFMAVVSYAFGMVSGTQSLKSLVLALTTGSMLTRGEFFPTINGPFWSLAVELWFSIAFPLVLLAVHRFGFRRVFILVVTASFLVRVPGAYFQFENIHANPLKDSVPARMDDFLVGMGVAYLYARRGLPSGTLSMFLGAVCCLVLSALAWDLRLQGRIPVVLTAILNNLTQAGCAGLIIVAIHPGSTFGRLISAWWLRILGAMCFSIYCWHSLLIRPAFIADPFDPIRMLEFWVILLLLSAFTFRFIEFAKTKSVRELFLLDGTGEGRSDQPSGIATR